MASTYPGSKQTFTNPSGSDTLDSPDHAELHANTNDTLEAIQDTVGTTAGTNVLKNFSAGDFPARLNSSDVLQQEIQGTVNNSNLGTPGITGGTASAFTLNAPTIGTPSISNGTITNSVINTPTIGTPDLSGGTAHSLTLGTPILDQFTSSASTTPSKVNVALAPTVVTLTDSPGGTLSVNAAAGQVFRLEMGGTAGNRTFDTPTNPSDGQVISFHIRQTSGNNGTPVWGTAYKMNESGTPTLGGTSTWNYVGFRYNGAGTQWEHQGNSLSIS